jgi:hypothetical protein
MTAEEVPTMTDNPFGLATNLYYIHAPNGDDEGDNLDLFVSAWTPAEAVALWIKYYDLDPDDLPGLADETLISLCPGVHADPGVHGWADIQKWNLTVNGGVRAFTARVTGARRD